MAVFRTHKIKNFTTINNYLIRDESLSLKDKGMMAVLLSLPETWEYSVVGLESICKESKNTINDILNNLEKNEYLERKRIYENGKIKNWEYNIYELPKTLYLKENQLHPKNQDIENLDIEILDIENSPQLNKEELNKEKINKRVFTPPTLDEIKDYCLNVRHNSVDYQKFYDYYNAGEWKDSKGNKIKNWKQKVITWESKEPKKKKEFTYETI